MGVVNCPEHGIRDGLLVCKCLKEILGKEVVGTESFRQVFIDMGTFEVDGFLSAECRMHPKCITLDRGDLAKEFESRMTLVCDLCHPNLST